MKETEKKKSEGAEEEDGMDVQGDYDFLFKVSPYEDQQMQCQSNADYLDNDAIYFQDDEQAM